MTSWTKSNNGHILTISIDEDNIINTLQNKANSFKQAIEEENDSEKFLYAEVGEYDRYLTLEECITDIEHMIDIVHRICCKEDPKVIFQMASFKKNGTFKRNVKPIIYEHRFGVDDKDSYGWRVGCLRIIPVDDYNAIIKYVNTIEHY